MTTTATNGHLDKEHVRALAAGRWADVLAATTKIPRDYLDGKGHPCPWCGAGDNRFSLIDEKAGAVLCRHCLKVENGDGFAAVMHDRKCSFDEAVQIVGDHVGATNGRSNGSNRRRAGDRNGQAVATPAQLEDAIRKVCEVKKIPDPAGLRAFNPKPANRYGEAVLRIPVYDENGNAHSYFDLRATPFKDGNTKGKFAAGKGSAGLFLPAGRKPSAGETWLLVEGVKDAAALTAMGYVVCGLPSSYLDAKYAPLFAGCEVVHVPDCDKPSHEGVEKTADTLRKFAASYRVARLPLPVVDSGGADVRDVLAMPDGEEKVRKAIDDAAPLGSDSAIAPMGIASLIETYPTLRQPIIDGLLRRGETANIIAPPKTGKSWLVYYLAIALATGCEIFQRFRTDPCKVLIIDNELHPETLAKRIVRVGTSMMIREDEYASIEVLSLRGRLMDLNALAELLRTYERGQYDAIVFDAWYRGLPQGVSENDNGAITQLYNLVDSVTEHLGAAWINVHHASKGEQGNKSVTDTGSGAGSQSRAADVHAVLREHEDDGVFILEAAVRSFPPVEPLALRWAFPLWEPADGIDTKKLKGRGNQQQRQRDKEGMEEITDALQSGPLTSRGIGKAVGMGADRRDKLLAKLVRGEKIEARDVVVCGNETTEYLLRVTELQNT